MLTQIGCLWGFLCTLCTAFGSLRNCSAVAVNLVCVHLILRELFVAVAIGTCFFYTKHLLSGTVWSTGTSWMLLILFEVLTQSSCLQETLRQPEGFVLLRCACLSFTLCSLQGVCTKRWCLSVQMLLLGAFSPAERVYRAMSPYPFVLPYSRLRTVFDSAGLWGSKVLRPWFMRMAMHLLQVHGTKTAGDS